MPKYFQDQKGVAHILVIVLLLLGLGLGLYLVTQRTNIFSRASTSSPISGPVSGTNYTVGGVVFVDTNGNRQKESDEQGYAQATVHLSQNGSVVQSVTSNSSGNYNFTAKPTGRYRITLSIPSGYNRVSDDSFEFNLDSNKDFNFAIAPKSTSTPVGSYKITGKVFIDSNSNGTFDSGESVYPSAAQVRLISQNFTDSGGSYELIIGPSRRYRITFSVPDGYVRTTDDSFEFELDGDKVFHFGIRPR